MEQVWLGPRRARYAWLSLAGLTVATVVLVFAVYARRERASALSDWNQRLSAWAEDRRDAIDWWAADRLSDATLTATYPTLAYLVEARTRTGPVPFPADEGPEVHAHSLLAKVVEAHGFGVGWVFDRAASVVAASPGAPAVSPAALECARQAVAESRPVSVFGLGESGAPIVAFGAPVQVESAGGGATHIAGAVVLQDDPARFLYPLLSAEPARTRTGEALLLGRVGQRTVFLSRRRNENSPPLTSEVPQGLPGLASSAALQGRETFGPFVDYRGTSVLAATRHLRTVPWALVVKVDEREALEAARREIGAIALNTGCVLLALLGLGLAVGRSQRAAFETALARRGSELAEVLDQANDAILFIGPGGHIRHANQRAAEMYACAREELHTLRLQDLRPPERNSELAGILADIVGRRRTVFETDHVRRDGTHFPIEASTRLVSYQGEQVVLAVVRDVSERRRSEARSVQLYRLLRTLTAVNQLARRETDSQQLLEGVCRTLIDEGGFGTAWIGFCGPDGVMLSAAASGPEERAAGEAELWRDDQRLAEGPVELALREGRTVAVADTRADQAFPVWSAAALARGHLSAAVSPIRSGAETDGVLAVYAGQTGVFEGEVLGLLDQLAADLGFALTGIEERRLTELAERALQESEANLAEAQRLGRVGSWDVDFQTGQVRWSTEQFRIHGQSPETFEPSWERVLAGLHPEDRASFEAWVAEHVRGTAEPTREFRIVRPDGAVRFVEVLARATSDKGGPPQRLSGTTRDVTERREADAALRHSEERFRKLAENAPDVLFRYRLGPVPGFEYVSPAVTAATGYTPDELYADRQVGLSVVHPDDRSQLDRLANGELGDGSVLTLRWIHRDGSLVWIEQRHVVERDAEGHVVALEGVARDVTARRRAEDELRKLSRVVEQSPVSVVVTDAGGNIEYVNPKFSEVTGYEPDEVLGRNPRLLKSDETPPETYRELWGAILAGREWRGELCNRRRNGDLFWEQAVISPITDAQGRTTNFIAVKEDITERKRAQATLRLAQGQLLQAQKMEAVGRLAGGVAHDFNNVLGVITGYSEIIRRSLAEDDPRRPKLDQVLHAAERAAGLTRQLLAFSRRQVLQPRALDLNALVSEMEKMLRRLIGEDVELRIALGSELHTVMADPGQLEQVLMNLAVNARDAMPDGGQLTIRTQNASVGPEGLAAGEPLAPGSYALLVVSDTGHGMDAATAARIFEPFFTTKGPDKGTGLGLATVYGIVAQSGGQIRVESAPQQGASFRVYLPSVDQPAASVSEPVLAPLRRGSETLLLAEDEGMLRELMEETLASCGYNVLSAADAEDATRLAEAHPGPIHLLVTDVIMPRTSGRELAAQVAAMRPATKVLYVSGYTADVIARHGVLEPGIAFLQKPFTGDELARRIREVLDGPPERPRAGALRAAAG